MWIPCAKTMASQKNILNFFKPLSIKRSLTDISESEGNTLHKKAKLDTSNENKDTTPREKNDVSSRAPYFSKYIQAKIKLVSKRYPALHANIGESWFEALSSEFGKPYFMKVTHCMLRSSKVILYCNSCRFYKYVTSLLVGVFHRSVSRIFTYARWVNCLYNCSHSLHDRI
jgi:hypothetical protein